MLGAILKFLVKHMDLWNFKCEHSIVEEIVKIILAWKQPVYSMPNGSIIARYNSKIYRIP